MGRPRIERQEDESDSAPPPSPAPPDRKTRVSYARKLQIVAHYEAHGDINLTLAKFFPTLAGAKARSKKQLIMRWTRERSKIAAICTAKGGHKSNDRKLGMSTTLSEAAEQAIVDWIKETVVAGREVSAKTLTERAMQAAREDQLHPDCFKASYTWRQLFLRRHGLMQVKKGRGVKGAITAQAVAKGGSAH